MEMVNQSEVARLRALIQAEYDAGVLAMTGSTLGSAQHKFITKRMENMQQYLTELRDAGGEEVFIQVLTRLGEENQQGGDI
jgi:hypothetical protein